MAAKRLRDRLEPGVLSRPERLIGSQLISGRDGPVREVCCRGGLRKQVRAHNSALYGASVCRDWRRVAATTHKAVKAGDIAAADLLVAELASQDRTRELRSLVEGHTVELVPIHALESGGVNEIPAALAKRLSAWLGFPINDSIVQTNTVGHTGASGFQRLANQALFAGEVEPQQRYLVVDDFVGQGGTLAPDDSMIQALREKHGQDLEDWWRQTFGFGYDSLTRSEARYLENSPDAHTIRDRLVAAGLESRARPSDAASEPLVKSEPAQHFETLPEGAPTPKPRQ